MKISVCVVIYDRVENLKIWLNCWDSSDKEDAELTIIHNYKSIEDIVLFKKLCENHEGVKYIQRQNVGYDIGALQDVCMERLYKFCNEWDFLIWCTDDTIPMKKTFIKDLVNKNKPGSPCMHISSEITNHVRTTGFVISKRISKLLTFNKKRIETKDDCYYFEHRGGRNTLYHQLIRNGEAPFMVSDLKKSPLWDISNKRSRSLNRMAEHNSVFKKNFDMYASKERSVAIICTIYNAYPTVIGSLIDQIFKNWKLFLVHDGKPDTHFNIKGIVDSIGDGRIVYVETESRSGNWGHKIRRDYLRSIKETDFDYVLITNHDNYHVPSFLEKMIAPLENNNFVASYCSDMIHSYVDHKVMPCSMRRGHVDCAGVIVKKDIACEIGFNKIEEHSADWFYFQDIINKYGARSFAKVNGCLLVHN
jgi:Glycosyl transferase family 2